MHVPLQAVGLHSQNFLANRYYSLWLFFYFAKTLVFSSQPDTPFLVDSVNTHDFPGCAARA